MTTPRVTELVHNGNPVGQRVELARYRIRTGERILYGQRIGGIVRITDCPAAETGRCYLVERELEQDGIGAFAALKALVADYIDQARRHREVPMTSSAVGRYLAELATASPGGGA